MALFCLIHVIKWACHARGLEPQAAIMIAACYTCVCLCLLLWHQSAVVGSLTERCHRGLCPAFRLWFNLLNNTWDRFSCRILARAFPCAFSSCGERQESKSVAPPAMKVGLYFVTFVRKLGVKVASWSQCRDRCHLLQIGCVLWVCECVYLLTYLLCRSLLL